MNMLARAGAWFRACWSVLFGADGGLGNPETRPPQDSSLIGRQLSKGVVFLEIDEQEKEASIVWIALLEMRDAK